MTDTLKLCPFCASPAEMIREKPRQWRVRCNRKPWPCFALGPIADSRRKATGLWNHRPVPKLTKAERDRNVAIVRALCPPTPRPGLRAREDKHE